MFLSRVVSAAAVAALISGAAYAQTAAPAPADAAATPAPAAAAAPAPAPAAPAFTPVAPAGDIVATLKASGEFKTFLKALDATNLTSVVAKNPNLTVFAPTDAAFAALPAGELDNLLKPANAAQLQQLLIYHIVNAPVTDAKIKGAKGPVKTVAGSDLLLDGSTDPFKANSAQVLQANVQASNGIVYVVDHVLSPSDPVIAQAAAEAQAAKAEAAATPAA
ncbi:MAG: fasciclin domain-containing protein [Ignavibacteriales bacterium]